VLALAAVGGGPLSALRLAGVWPSRPAWRPTGAPSRPFTVRIGPAGLRLCPSKCRRAHCHI